MSFNKTHHKCFTKRSPSLFFSPHSIFYLYHFFISNCWANDSDAGFRSDSDLPSNLFQPPFDSAEGETALGHCLITGVNRNSDSKKEDVI